MVNIADFGTIACIVIIFIILFLLWRSNQWTLSKKILFAIYFVILFVMMGFYSVLHDMHFLYGLSFVFYDSVGYILGPLFLIYLKSLYLPEKSFIQSNYKHFIPFSFILVFIQLPTLITWNNTEYTYISFLNHKGLKAVETYFQSFFFVLYCIVILLSLSNVKKRIKFYKSNLEDNNLRWIKYLVLGSMIAMSLDTIIIILQSTFGNLVFAYHEYTFDGGVITIYIITIVILFSSYFGLAQTNIFIPSFVLTIPDKEVARLTDMQSTISVKDNIVLSKLIQKSSSKDTGPMIMALEKIMKIQKPYLEEGLSLRKLADYCRTTDKKLSCLLNEELQLNFYDYINSYRVRAVKLKFMDKTYAHYSILAVAYDCGFKSKSSFNRIFKKHTGVSPSSYRASLRKI